MNFLAHLILSGNNDNIKLGNFIADSVKGNKYNNFPEQIKSGILLHRKIDHFTDNHKIVKESKVRFKEYYGRHSGVIIDIFYDHFLSQNWQKYSTENRKSFIRHSYMILAANYLILPIKIKYAFPFLVLNDWLGSYNRIEGLESVLNRMSFRTSLPNKTSHAIDILRKDYNSLNDEFLIFLQCISY